MINGNQKNCSTTRKNLGLPDCILELGIPKGFIIVPKGWSLNLTSDTFDLDYVNDQIQLGNFVPVLGASEFTNNTPEATTQEFQGGAIEVVRDGLPYFAFKFTKGGWAYAQALATWDSTNAFDILLVFANGSIAGATTGTLMTGFDLGMLNTGTYMFTDGTNKASVTVVMQLVDADQYNLNAYVLDASVLDFKANSQLFPITDIVITGRADVSEQKVYFKPVFRQNGAVTLGGIAIANLKSYVSGTADTITALSLSYNSSTKEWGYTPTATLTTSTPVIVQLYDSSNSIDVAKIGTKYYKGESAAITPVA